MIFQGTALRSDRDELDINPTGTRLMYHLRLNISLRALASLGSETLHLGPIFFIGGDLIANGDSIGGTR